MDFKRLDVFRRNVGPVQLDLIESYARGRIGRRDFLKRGAIVGLSMPVMGSIIAACGSDDGGSTDGGSSDTASSGDSGSVTQGGNLVAAIQQGDANSGLDPVNMFDLGTYCVVSQCFEYLVGLGDDGNIDATALATSWEPNEDGSVWTFTLREGVKWQSGGDLDVGRRGRHHGPPGRSRQRRSRRRDRRGFHRRLRSGDRRHHPARAQRQLPGSGLDLQHPVGHHAGRLHRRHHAR